MPKFLYTARDREANLINGVIEGHDEAFVVKELKKRGFTPVDISLEKEQAKAAAAVASSGMKGKVKSMDLVVFSRQLATLIDAGISLVMSLNILYDQVENPFLKKIISNIKNDIESGNSLSAAFSKYQNVFPTLFSNMIRAGESSGSLNEILDRVADYLERIENLKRKITSSLMYPVVIVGMAILINAFLILKVVPTFKGIFESLGGQLPGPTQFLINVSNFSLRFFPFIAIFLFVATISFFRYINTEGGRYKFDNVKLKLPLFGPLINKVSISKLTRTLSTLIRSGVSILEAFEISGKVVGNKVIEQACDQVRLRLRAGENIAEPMEETGKFPPFVVKMIAVGEQTGELEKMLGKISDYYDSQVNDSLSGITSIIEPLIIAFLGVTIGFVVLAMFLPIFKLSQMIGSK